MDFTRRSFFGAAAAALAAGRMSAAVPTGPVDVAIIGAGAAGIAAAYALRDAKKSYVILEARNRAGGRARSDNTSIPGVPVDLGAEWFIQVNPIPGSAATTNPLYDLAAPRTKELGIVPDNFRRTFFDLSSPNLPPGKRLAPAILEAANIQASIAAYGTLMQQDPTLPDISVEALAEMAGIRSSIWYDFAVTPLVNEHGVSPDKISVMDVALLMAGGPTVGGFLIQSGLGNFVGSLANDLPVQMNTPVTTIHWQNSGGGVQLDTPAGTVTAKSVIVTVPVGVLAGGQPAFDPPLPSQYTDAFGMLPMGVVEKMWLSYSEDIFGVPDQNVVAEQLVGTSPGYQFHWFGGNVIGVIVGGDLAAGSARAGLAAQLDYAKQAVAAAFGSATLDKFQSGTSSSWLVDPYSRGCYTCALPGGVPARLVLGDMAMAKSMLANRVFFAGEATAFETHSGLPGAWTSGQRAAAAAMASA